MVRIPLPVVMNGLDERSLYPLRLFWGTSRKLAVAEPPLQIHRSSRMISHTCISPPRFLYPFGSLHLKSQKLSLPGIVHHRAGRIYRMNSLDFQSFRQMFQREFALESKVIREIEKSSKEKGPVPLVSAITSGHILHLFAAEAAAASEEIKANAIYEVGELFELGIQLSYLLLLLGLLGVGTFFVIRQVLVRRELDLSAKELQEQVRSGDASATEYFELGAVMLRRKFYPAAIKYLLQAIEKWDGDDQDLAQVYNALGVCYVRDEKLDKGISQFETAVKLQPGYVTAWNNLGDAYERKKELNSALKAFEEVLLFDPNNKIARPRRDALKDRVDMYRGVSVKPKKR